jgi:hypothetical protein
VRPIPATNPIAVLDAVREKDEAAFAYIELVIAAEEGERAFEDVKDLIFGGVRVARPLVLTGRVLEHRESSPLAAFAKFDDEVNPDVVDPPCSRLQRVRTDPVKLFHSLR